MSERLLRLAANFEVDNKIVPWEELISHPPHLLEIAAQLRRTGWPSRTWKGVQQELLRLHARWEKKKPTYKTEAHLRYAGSNPSSWAEESEDDDDIFMPSEASKRAASSKGKGEASSKGKGVASRVKHCRRGRVLRLRRARELLRLTREAASTEGDFV